MILTVTMNPSIDISSFDVLQLIQSIAVEVSKTAGGKANVTRVLSEIKDPVAATGLLGGRTAIILDH